MIENVEIPIVEKRSTECRIEIQCPIEQSEQEGNKALLIVCFSIAFGLGVLTGAIICAFCA